MDFKIPNRFETLFSSYKNAMSTLLVEPKGDLEKFQRIALEILRSNQGKIVFLQGKPGIGKSTFAYSLPIFLSEYFHEEIRVPSKTFELKLSDIPEYIHKSLTKSSKLSIITIDNRESPKYKEDDLNDLFSDLKSILRENSNLLIIWPVVNEEFANKAIEVIKNIGGMSSLAHEPVIKYIGLDDNKYYHVLERMLRIHNVILEDFGISIDEVKAVQYSGVTISEFLNEISNLITKKTLLDPPKFGFDKLIFSISSSTDDLLNVARELRRGDTFYLEASRLLLNTRDSRIAEWWNNRNDDPQTSLAYVINLFQAELTTLSSTVVVHACDQFGEPDLKEYTKGITSNLSNAKRAMKSSELFKAISNMGDDSNRKGTSPSDELIAAYDKIQKASEKRHKAINSAIMTLLQSIEDTLISDVNYEVASNGVIADVVVKIEAQKHYIEFHHKSFNNYNPNKVAIYILEKLKEYAIAYGIAER